MDREQYPSSIIDESAKFFKNIRCTRSTIGANCCIGDDCDIDSLVMEERSELGRRNLIRNAVLVKSFCNTTT